MKKLESILNKVSIKTIHGSVDVIIDGIYFDSRNVKQGSLFLAQNGVNVDGHHFIDKALVKGASVVVCEVLPDTFKEGVVYVEVEDSSSALAAISANYFDNPSEKLKLIGITGTNGKTTITTLLYQLLKNSGAKVGLLSTLKILVDDKEYKATHTTPDSVSINKYLSEMVACGVEYCFMEVSSHGIHQKRADFLHFEGGVFTNLTHDHLDYHENFAAYRDVKKSFFDNLPKTSFALTNLDDKNGKIMLQNTKAKKLGYTLKTIGDFKGKIIEKSFSGSLLIFNGVQVWTKLIGEFNAYNLLAIYGVAELLGLEKLESLRLLSQLESVDGRFQYVISEDKITAVVDYAHTPDALKNVLQTINGLRVDNESVITVVGCGGDRDKSKRSQMASIASYLSSQVIFTSDNPRTEDPQSIINDMEEGVAPENKGKTLSILDRKQAIKTACKLSTSGDIILIAGKGHEKYQEIQGKKIPFNDLEEVVNCFNQ
ncbi:MAG TPA: UDP-N-acetylmuramoyl-L-alanyl-D-glutamate--2,6-diaminopimelate ligase [Tenacibaculum sp.]|nr:UDP-N-acetylmuramoyl-L-alanyl-D-glutamate--2,6-diaminopimelate ligase [Tenacibaculum sp.]